MDDFLEHFRLQAVIRESHTEIQVGWRNQKRVEKWERDKWLGRGAYGKVWLERTNSGQLRAVKEVEKYIPMDHLKEIRAIAKFSKVRLWIFILMGSV